MNKDTEKTYLYRRAKMMFLIVHFELENYDLLYYVVRSTDKWIKKNKIADNQLHEFECFYVNWMKDILMRIDNGESLKQGYLSLLDRVKQLPHWNKYNSIELEQFEWQTWLESKIDKIS